MRCLPPFVTKLKKKNINTVRSGRGLAGNLLFERSEFKLPSVFGYFFGDEKSNINTGQVSCETQNCELKLRLSSHSYPPPQPLKNKLQILPFKIGIIHKHLVESRPEYGRGKPGHLFSSVNPDEIPLHRPFQARVFQAIFRDQVNRNAQFIR